MRIKRYLPNLPSCWTSTSIICALFVLAPLIAIGSLALNPIGVGGTGGESGQGGWQHLFETIILDQALTTLALMLGIALLTGLIGLASAWFVTFYRFPGRRLMEWLLLLPLAIPTYIAAYIYTDLLDKAGAVYPYWQQLFGTSLPYPELHSLGGAIFIMSTVLYPYVFLSARTSFLLQSTDLIEAGRALGASPANCFWRIALPMSRPALVVGISLALMECLNDIGAVEHLGVTTLTVGVYDTWLARGNLMGAAQMAMVLLGFMGLLLWLERTNRQKNSTQGSTSHRLLSRFTLSKHGQIGALAVCLIPVILGFIIPLLVLATHLISTSISNEEQIATFTAAARNSLFLASIAALITVTLGLFLAYAARTHKSKTLHRLTHISALGYAIPGTVLGLGMLVFLVQIDAVLIDPVMDMLGMADSFFVTGTLFGLLAAYIIRFLTIAFGTVDAGLKNIPPNIDIAANSLGAGRGLSLWRVHIPLLRPTLIGAGILVFVDAMKELPATLILRPFDFETLSTQVYTYASLGQIEDAALPALLIVLVGILPVILATKIMTPASK